MDDPSAHAHLAHLGVDPGVYRCPGHSYTIDRSAHLARLADYYPPCRQCEHRHEVVSLPADKRRGWAELESRPVSEPTFAAEAFESPTANALTLSVIGRLAAALATTLATESNSGSARGPVLVAADGSWTTADLVAAACQTLHYHGCQVIDVGAASTAPLATLARRRGAAAAMWVGHATGGGHALAAKFWGPRGRPWSSPGGLDRLRESFQQPSGRSSRHGGLLSRAPADEPYLAELRPQFHALRPLRLVLRTRCEPLAAYLDTLASGTGCRFVRAGGRPEVGGRRSKAESAKEAPLSGPLTPARLGSPSQLDEFGSSSSLQSPASYLPPHGALEISGDGERLRVFDEHGAAVDDDALFWTMAQFVRRQQSRAGLVLGDSAATGLRDQLRDQGPLTTSASAREAMFAAMESSGAALGRGDRGQYWFAGEPPVPDALLATSLLLVIWSATDRPISQALALA